MSLTGMDKNWVQNFGDTRWVQINSTVTNTDVSLDFGTITTPTSALDADFGSIV